MQRQESEVPAPHPALYVMPAAHVLLLLLLVLQRHMMSSVILKKELCMTAMGKVSYCMTSLAVRKARRLRPVAAGAVVQQTLSFMCS